MTTQVLATIVSAAAGGLLGGLGPVWLRRIPEPKDAEDDKRSYVELASMRGLSAWLAMAAAIIAGSIGWSIDSRAILPLWVFLAAVGVLLSYIDWHTRRLPTRIVAPSYAVVLALLTVAGYFADDWHRVAQSLIAGAAVFALFFVAWLIVPHGMGYGDVRLSGILGIALGWLGWSEVFVGIYAGFVFGAILGLILGRLKIVDAKGFAFGPFMIVGAWFGAVFGPAVSSYLL